MESKESLKNFVECKTESEANAIDMSEYRFEKFDNDRGYVFVRRANRVGL